MLAFAMQRIRSGVTLVVLIVIVFLQIGWLLLSSQLPSNLYFNRRSQTSLFAYTPVTVSA